MSKKERTRLEGMQRLKAKRLSQAEASGMLGISVRQVKRLYAAYRKRGAKVLVTTAMEARAGPTVFGLAAIRLDDFKRIFQ